MATKQSEDSARKRTNATVRLSAVLDKLAANSSSVPVADLLGVILGIQDADQNRTFLLAYTAITGMLERSENEVKTYLESEALFYGAHFQPLRQCFSPKNSGQPWNTYKVHLSQNEVTGIKHTAQRLRSLVPEFEPSESEFIEISVAIEEMSNALEEEQISEHSRERLHNCLNQIRRAINEYKIWGATGLDEALITLTGTLVTDPILQQDLKKNDASGSTLWKQIAKVGGALLLASQILHGWHEVAQDYFPTIERLILPKSTEASSSMKAPHT